MKTPLFCGWLAAALLCALPVSAQKLVPRKVSIQGVLRDGDGALQSRSTNVTVRFFTKQTGGDQVGDTSGPTEVEVVDGLFTVEVVAEPAQWADLPDAPWLELTVGDDKYARQALTSVPFALASVSAERLSAACSGCVRDAMIAELSATKVTDVLPLEHGGTGVSEVEDWKTPAPQNWENYGKGYAPLGYYKDPFGLVHLRGLANKPAAAMPIMFTLPAGYRPAMQEIFLAPGQQGGTNVACRIDVSSAGVVQVGAPCATMSSWIALSGITFRAP